MNILIVVPWDQSQGGVTSVVTNLANYLKERGYQVFFFHPEGRAFFLRPNITRLGFRGFKLRLGLPCGSKRPILSTLAFPVLFPLALLELSRLILRNKIDVVNVHYASGQFVYFALCRKLFRIKLVTSIHGADVFPKGQPRQRYGWPLRLLLRSSDLIVANSHAFMRDFLALFPHLNEKTLVIHNGVDLAVFYQSLREEYCWNGHRYLLSVAMYNEKKGLDVLIRAFSEIAKRDPKLDLFLVGDGHLRTNLEGLAKSLELEERVKFLGRKEHAEVTRLIHGCEVFVHPAISEPFGIAVVEALACRKPVVASAAGGIPEIIQDGENGVLVEPANSAALAAAISSILTDPVLRHRLSENGYKTVQQHFLHRNTGHAYHKVLTGLCS